MIPQGLQDGANKINSNCFDPHYFFVNENLFTVRKAFAFLFKKYQKNFIQS